MIFLFFALLSAHAQDLPKYLVPTVVVTPLAAETQGDPDLVVEIPRNATSKAVTLDDVLRGVPGVTVARAGGLGQPSSLFLRGAASEHTLVLLDGVEINDPSQPTGGFDFSTVDLNLIERVEIFKGPQTLRFGSGAMGGVINIVTQRGPAKKKFFAAARAGSFATNQQSVGAIGEGYALSATRFENEGISAARGRDEKDGHQHMAVAGRFSFGNWEFVHRSLSSRSDLDFATSTSGPYFLEADDPNYFVSDFQSLNALKRKVQGEGWSSETTFSHFYLQRRYENKIDERNAAYFLDHRFANALKAEHVFAKRLSSTNLSFGPSLRHEEAKYSDTLTGIFGEISYKKDWQASAGARFDHHPRFGGHFTYSVSPGYKWRTSKTLLTARFATAFKAPSLFQLHDPTFGNKDLNPEQVRGEELSFEQLMGEWDTLRATVFRYLYSDLIQFSTKYQNLSTAKSQGFELEYSRSMHQGFDFQIAYAYTDARNEQTGARLLRRPFHGYRASVGAEIADSFSARAEYRAVGSRTDIDALAATPTMTKGYDILDLSMSKKVSRDLQATLSFENAFGKRYEEVSGYGTPGFGVFAGLRFDH